MDTEALISGPSPKPTVSPFDLRRRVTADTRVTSARSDLQTEARHGHEKEGVTLGRVLIAAASISCLVVLFVYLASLRWSGVHQSHVAISILSVQIIGGVVPVVVYVLAVIALAALIARRPTRRRVIADLVGVGAGAVAALTVLITLSETNALGITLTPGMISWTILGFGGIGLGLANLWTSRGWRMAIAAACVILVGIAGTIGINADFGLDPTIGALAGISTEKVIKLPLATTTPVPVPTILDGGALWANWTPSAPVSPVGTQGQIDIPGIVSGFRARPAGLYLPPAALEPNAPALPLVIMLMGQPGNPDPGFQRAILDNFAARHNGLAPIVLVADQIGNPSDDPLCTNDTRYGNAETYITQDVVTWARTNLHVLQDPAHWTIAGYSNGGECAASFGAQFPNIWGNVLDISGEEYPGSDEAAATLADVFNGNRAAYEATWPANIMATGTYPDTVGIFTVSTNDPEYIPQAKAVAAAATAAQWKTTYFEVPNGGHVLGALNGGLTEGYTILYPRLGLSDPSTAP